MSLSASVLVVVIVVSCVAAPVVNVVDVITMRDRHMSAALAVNMVMTLMHRVVAGGFAFVVVVVVRSMKMTVVHVVDVIAMRDRDVTAPFAVDMVVADMFLVCSSHCFLPGVSTNSRLMLAPPRARIP